jgi:hypothetical protein
MQTTVTRADAGRAPTVLDVRAGLTQTLGAEESDRLWSSICTEVGVHTDATDLDAEQLDRLLTALSGHGRLCNVLAMSWRIRATAARKLADLGR